MTPAEEHRSIAGTFTDRVRGVPAGGWDRPAPCEGWVARDVVDHLVTWLPHFLRTGAGVELPEGPSAGTDPVAAWLAHAAAVQAVLDDPACGDRVLSNPFLGELPLDVAISRFYTSDVFLHTWDLARATGQDDRLDPERCAMMLKEMAAAEAAMRSSGHYGPPVEVPDDADVQTKLLGFIGRDPAFASALP